MATVIWIGGMATNLLVLLPSMREALEPPIMGKLMGSVMKRFRPLVYASMIILVASGIVYDCFKSKLSRAYPA
ncbi:MAG: hypothetical protein ACUVTD_07800 [Nitrososphaerales archaeon]